MLGLFLVSSYALAEGTEQLNETQALRQTTQLFVDASGDGTERLRWVGIGTVTVTSPDGGQLETLSSGQHVVLSGDSGPYGVYLNSNQSVGSAWDIALLADDDGVEIEELGRLFSYDWKFNAGAFASSRATYSSFYALVPGGAVNTDAVIELKLDGLAGYVFNLSANRTGVDGASAGRSVPQTGNSVTPEFPIYLSPPGLAKFGRVSPELSGFTFAGGVGVDVLGNSIVPCAQLVPGDTQGRFFFTTNVEGSYHLQCDLDGDGTMDGGQDDLLLIGTTSPGTNVVYWGGEHQGALVEADVYSCEIRVNVGEFHYVGRDIETSYPGMRLFEVHSDLSRTGLSMHWNDSQVQNNAQTMPNDQTGLESSGTDGILSAEYEASTQPNTNARSWGAFNSQGKGNQAFLDTYVWMESSGATTISVSAVAGTQDADGDGLTDFEEECSIGSNPDSDDTDGDGIADYDQYSASSSGIQGGLESNGTMASRIAQRSVELTRRSPWTTFALNSSSTLSRWVPELGDSELLTVNSTPYDLLSLTNAQDVYAVDYLSPEGETKAGLLLLETKGATYEHNKAACDRANGAELTALGILSHSAGSLPLPSVVAASYRNLDRGTHDYAITFKLYPGKNGRLRLYSQWLMEDYPPVLSGQTIVNGQLWASSETLAKKLLAGVMSRLHNDGALEGVPTVETIEDNDHSVEVDLRRFELMASREPLELPGTYFSKGNTLGGRLTLSPVRLHGSEPPLLRLIFLAENGNGERVEYEELNNWNTWSKQYPLFRDVTVEVLQDDKVIDRLWLSDGAWAAFHDGLWGGGSKGRNLSTKDCFSYVAGRRASSTASVALAGCAQSDTDVEEFGGVARHLSRPIPTSPYAGIRFHATSLDDYQVCLEDPTSKKRSCSMVPGTPIDGRWTELEWHQFVLTIDGLPGVPQAAQLLTFATRTTGRKHMTISELSFVDQQSMDNWKLSSTVRGSRDAGGGCSLPRSTAPPRYQWLLLFVTLGIVSRRKRSR